MSIYLKLAMARAKFHSLPLKKSGLNKFAGYKYFELGDFLIPGMECLAEQGLVPVISFETDLAYMHIHDVDDTDGHRAIVISSPMSTAALKGCHEIQNLGAVQTYLRRYLWVTALEIVEHDQLDSTGPVKAPPKSKPQTLADDVQLLTLDDYLSAGQMDEKQTEWYKVHRDTLTKTDAASVIKKLKEKNQ
jgi:hypothetical protein